MKNFPDHDPFDEVEKRLQAYTEQPDELVWENIDASLRPQRPLAWIPWVDHFTSALSVFMFTLVITVNQSNDIITYENGDQNKSVTPYRNEGNLSFDDDQPHNRPDAESNKKSSAALPFRKEILARATDNVNAQLGRLMEEPRSIFDTTNSFPLQSNAIENEFANESMTDSLLVSHIKTQKDSLAKDLHEIQTPERRRKKRRILYVKTTPGLSFQRAIPMQNDGVVVSDFLNPSILSAERFGFSVEAGMQGFITKRLEYYGGLSFYRQNQTLRYRYQSGNSVNMEAAEDKNYIVTPKSSMGMVNYSMVNVGVEAGMLYHLYGKNLAHKIGAGVSYHHGIEKNSTEVYDNSESNYFSYQVFYRNELRVNNQLRIFIQPTFTQSIRAREKLNAPFHLKPYRAGIGLGILYNF